MRNLLFINQEQTDDDVFALLKVGPNIGFSFIFRGEAKTSQDSILRDLSLITSELFVIEAHKIEPRAAIIANSKANKPKKFSKICNSTSRYFEHAPEIVIADLEKVNLRDFFASLFFRNVFTNKTVYLKELQRIFKRAKNIYHMYTKPLNEHFGNIHAPGFREAKGHRRKLNSFREDRTAQITVILIETLAYVAVLIAIYQMDLCPSLAESSFIKFLQKRLHGNFLSEMLGFVLRGSRDPWTCMALSYALGLILLKPVIKLELILCELLLKALNVLMLLFKASYKFIWRKFRDFFLLINDKYYSPQIKVD